MLPALVQRLPEDRDRLRLREVQMAGRLHLTSASTRALEARRTRAPSGSIPTACSSCSVSAAIAEVVVGS